MILGTGIDIVEISRIRNIYERWGGRFALRILSGREGDVLKKRMDPCLYLASRFAAKEAFLKALGTGFGDGIRWAEIEIERKKGHRPFFYISGRAREVMENLGANHMHLSISHEKHYAVAQVILED